MPQIYILTILMCLFTGGVLAAEMLVQKAPFLGFLKKLQEKGSQLLLGGVVFVLGILKLVIPSPTESSVFFGDLLPALVGIIGGGMLVIEALYRDRDVLPSLASKVIGVRKQYGTAFGIIAIILGIVHLILPGVILL